MRNMRKTACVFISLFLVPALLSLAAGRRDDNCFTVIVGKKASADGSVIIGHNDDDRGDIIVNLRKVQARDYGGPRTIGLGKGGSFETDGKTNAFLWVEATTQEFADSFVNQYGVVITSDSCPSRETRSDLTAGGIGYMLRRIMAEKAKSARDAVKIAGELVEKFGYRDSGRTYLIADRNEAWMMAIIRGRHWFAERVPDDEVAVIPNYYTIRRIRLNDRDYFMGSRDIVEYARKNGWYDETKDGPFDFKKAFQWRSGRDLVSDGNTLRHWRGLVWLSGRKWEMTGDYPFSFKPGRKVTAESLMEILRDHYEGTEYDATDGYKTGTPNRTKFRTICTASTIYSFIASLNGKRPEPISAALWLALGKPDTTVYLPLYYGVESLPPGAGLGIRTHDDEVFYRQHFDDAEFKAAKDRLLQTKILELQKTVEANYGPMIETVKRELSPAEKTFIRDRTAFESDFLALYVKNKKEAAKKLDESIAAAFDKISVLYGKLLANSPAATDTPGSRRENLRLTAGEYKVSFSSDGAVLAVETKGGARKTGGPDTAGEIILKGRSYPLTEPVAVEEKTDGLHFIYEVASNPRLRVELVHRLTQIGPSVRLSREISLVSSGLPAGPAPQTPQAAGSPETPMASRGRQTSQPAPGAAASQHATVPLAKFGADLTVRLPLAPFELSRETWLPQKNGLGRLLADDKQAAYRFAGSLRSSGVPLAIPMVSFVSQEFAGRVTVAADPYYSTLFSGDAIEWTYPEAVGLENGRESRSLSFVFHQGTSAVAVAEFYQAALPDVPSGPAWLHDIAMVDYDYLSDGGRGWFKDIDALSAAIPREDRSKVLLCLHGWYDFVGRYTFNRLAKTLDTSWTAFSNYPNVKRDFPSNVPVAMTLKDLHDRLAYARSRGFRVGLYFADGMNAGDELPDIFAPERVLRWGGWQGPDTKGKTYVQNPLCPEVRGFFLDYVKALLREYGNELDALVWDETFHVGEGSLGSSAVPGYADRAMMRLTADITAEVRAFDRRAGREVAFMASDCIGVFNWVTKPPYALAADGTYQDTHCAPEAWSYGVFPNFRNVLWSCNWEPVTHWDYTEFGVRNYQTPVAISNGWGDYCGFAAMSLDMKQKVLALFDWRKRFATRYEVRDDLPVYHGNPAVKCLAEEGSAGISFLSWDTEGADKVDSNLLRADSAVRLQFLENGAWRDAVLKNRRVEADGAVVHDLAAGRARLTWRVDPGAIRDAVGVITLTISAAGRGLDGLRLLFPFDPKVTPTTVLPGAWLDDGTFRLPAVINAPDFGPMLVKEARSREVIGRLEGSRKDKVDDLTFELPEISSGVSFTLTLAPVLLPPPPGLRDTDLWRLARRGWLNALQPCARWGEQGKSFSSPPGILGNNVISDPASVSLWFYADQALFTPEIAPGISLMPLVRRTIDYWLDQRMRRDEKGQLTGEITGYWDYGNFLDANASPLIAAWDYVEATGDLAWLKVRIERLELVADFLARRDVDGFVEAVQSGNRGTLVQPNRSCSWWDALNCGHKDGYTNALIYRAWRTLADLESRLGRGDQAAAYTRLADRLKAVYSKTLFNPQTGWLAWWKSADGELHDYASPTLNGLAIEYGLVEPALGRQILDRLWKKIGETGFTRFDLGVPPMLVPVHRSDYLQPDAIGIPKREDGTDTFGCYMNGGITAGHVLHFLAAHDVLGEGERADRILRAMLERQARGEFQNGVRDAGGEGIDWTTWDGKPSGYEGYLADSFRFLQAVLLRESEFRARLYRPLQGPGPARVGAPGALTLSSTAKEIKLTEGLAVGLIGSLGRSPVPSDLLAWQLAAGTMAAPREGLVVGVNASGWPQAWARVEAGAEGWIEDPALAGGTLFIVVNSEKPRTMVLEASSFYVARVNGVPRGGEKYGADWVRHPVLLIKGRNEFLIQCERGRFRGRLIEPPAEVFFTDADMTLPDLVFGEKGPVWAGLRLVNATGERLAKIEVLYRAGGREGRAGLDMTEAPLMTQKLAVPLAVEVPAAEGMVPVEVRARVRAGGRIIETPAFRIELRAVAPTAHNVRTFVSEIDRSVQLFAVAPLVAGDGGPASGVKPALVLTLHGAGVDAINQARAYKPKNWAFIVAPTNRRPYGFDWEDWGRLDALEVLAEASRLFGTDPDRTYLTGHSMGGHGTWQVGATVPGLWAAIAPSAGWPSFSSYGGGVVIKDPSPVERMLARANNPSETANLARNYLHYGIYILHGDQDDNVPVTLARSMRELLGTFHPDFCYYERPGAGHWWGNECVDWPPLFEFLKERVRPSAAEARKVEFVTASPGISSRSRWVEVLAQTRPLEYSQVVLERNMAGTEIKGTTGNVLRLAIDIAAPPGVGKVTIEVDGSRVETSPTPGIPRAYLERGENGWLLTGPPVPGLKGPQRSGGFKDAFRHGFVLVYGTHGDAEENARAFAKARFDAEMFWVRGNSGIEVLPDTAFDPAKARNRNVILYGNADTNSTWPKLLAGCPVDVRNGRMQVGGQRYTASDLAAYFVRPRPGSDIASVGVVAWTGRAGWVAVSPGQYFISGAGFPDLMLFSAETLRSGAAGVRAIGWFGDDWSVEKGDFVWNDVQRIR